MPIYEYHCSHCGADLEIFQHMTDSTLRLCPECKAEALEKVYSPVGIVFKGSGFYATDNKRTKTAAAPPGQSDAKPTTESSGGSGSSGGGSDTGGTDKSGSTAPAPSQPTTSPSVDKSSKPAASVDA